MFDLTVFPLSIQNGREQYELPGLLIASAPRKTIRLRAQDQVLLYWELVTHPSVKPDLSPSQQQEILNRIAETYFTTQGSVTAGLRTAIHRLNEFLLNRNLRSAQEGQWLGILNAAVIHHNTLLLAHAGPTHSFVLTRTEVQHYIDGQGTRGLGFSRQVAPRFFQAEIQPADLLVFCSQPPPAWTDRALANSPQLSMDYLRRRLFSETTSELKAVVVRFLEGKGQVSYWRPEERAGNPNSDVDLGPKNFTANDPGEEQFSANAPVIHPAADPAAQEEPSVPLNPIGPSALFMGAAPDELLSDESQGYRADYGKNRDEMDGPGLIPPWEEEPNVVENPQSSESGGSNRGDWKGVYLNQPTGAEIAAPHPSRRPTRSNQAMSTVGTVTEQDVPLNHEMEVHSETVRGGRREARQSRTAREKIARPPRPNPIRIALASLWRRGGAARARTDEAIAKAGARAFPNRSEPFFNIPASVLLLIAIAVPLVVVAVATTVYLRAGRSEQYQLLIGQAQQYAHTASLQTDPNQLRESWGKAYELVRSAERYEQTEESFELKEQALHALDDLEGLVRLDYQPVNGSLGNGVKITKMVATPTGVYMLDSTNGNIIHLVSTSTGFELNPAFRCGSGKAGTVIVGPLVDIAPLSLNNELRASVVGIDSSGTVVYCSTNSDKFSATPLALPDAGWGHIVSIATLDDTLYVLDPQMRAVYWYDNLGGIYTNKPHLYFETNPPGIIEDVIEMSLDSEFLYLLHADGKMTVCETSQFAFVPTRCTEPMPYGDSRAGYDPAPLSFAGSRLTQLQVTQPPDPSLYALDELNQSVYHLSLRRLNLQRQFRPRPESDFPLPEGSPTAFVVTQNRRVLLAFGDRVFFAPIP